MLCPWVRIANELVIAWWRHGMDMLFALLSLCHDDVIKWKHFPRNWTFVRGIHRSPVNSPHKGQWRGALMFTLICTRINGGVNNGEAGDLRRYRPHYDVIVMWGKHAPVIGGFPSQRATTATLSCFLCSCHAQALEHFSCRDLRGHNAYMLSL